MLALKDGVAVVTGAAGGIGGALAVVLARKGCHLALADMKAEPLAEVAARARSSGVNVTEHVFDVSNAAAIAALPETVRAQHGRVTILINNAGAALGGTFEQVSLDEFEWLMNVNFWSVVRMMKAFLPLLKEQTAAQIVNISSVFGLIGPPGQCAYSASKFAVRGVSEVLRHEMQLAGNRIGVTVVHPGGVRTGIAKNARTAAAMPAADAAKLLPLFDKLLRSDPAEVAAHIAAGIEKRENRIVVGADSGRIDIIQRLLPASYWSIFGRTLKVRKD